MVLRTAQKTRRVNFRDASALRPLQSPASAAVPRKTMLYIATIITLAAQPNELFCPKTGRAEECGPEVCASARV